MDNSLSTLTVDAQDHLCQHKAGLRTLAALLECYSDHGTNGEGYIDQPNLVCGLASLLTQAADCLDQQSEALGAIEVVLRDVEDHPPLGAVATTGHHVERLRVPQ